MKLVSVSDGKLSPGLLVTPSRSRTVLLYSRCVRRRSGMEPAAFGSGGFAGSTMPGLGVPVLPVPALLLGGLPVGPVPADEGPESALPLTAQPVQPSRIVVVTVNSAR